MSFSETPTPPDKSTGKSSGDDSPFDPSRFQQWQKQQKEIAKREDENRVGEKSELAGMEAELGIETDEVRLNRYVEKHFEAECPPEFREAATGKCLEFETKLRRFKGKDFQLDEKYADRLRPEIVTLVEKNRTYQKINTTTEAVTAKANTIHDNDKTIAKNNERIKTKDTRIDNLKTEIDKTESGIDEIARLQAEFQRLKAEKGTIGALRDIFSQSQNPKIRARINNVLRTAEALQTAVPGKADLITRFIDRSNLNLGAESMVAVFADFTAHVDSSDEFTDEEKATIHKTIGSVRTGDNATISDMSDNLDRKAVVYDEDGNPVETDDPAFDGEENAIEVRDGIIVYVENGEKIMKNTRTGQTAELDASLGGVEHTRALMEFWQSQNSLLAAGVENAWGLPLAKEHREYTVKELHQFQRNLQLLQGGERGLSPVVQREGEQSRFARNFLIISQRGTATPFTHSREEMEQSRAGLGLEERLDSARNEEILDAIGNFLNTPANSGLTGEALYIQLQRHLHGLFPHHVAAPGANSALSEDRAAA